MWSYGYCRGDRVTMGAAVCGPMDTVGGIGSPWGLLYRDRVTMGAAVCVPTDTVGGIGSPWGLLYVAPRIL